MQIIPEPFLQIIQQDKNLHKAILDIDEKIESIVKQTPVFFPEYTDHGIEHFKNTLFMAHQLLDIDDDEKSRGGKAVIDNFSPLNAFVLTSSILYHDIGMHIHFKGFKQLIEGYFDDVRVDFFDENTWKKEWDDFMIEAKRFSGRERINIFGDEQVIIKDIDFTKDTVDSDIQKYLIGEFIRRHHGRLSHEISLKGFPIEGNEVINLAPDSNIDYKDIIGVISRSHSMNIREAMEFIADKYPADPLFPHNIEIPFLMCVIRIADYFQFDKSRTNSFSIKLRSFTSPFSYNEHKTHLATEYFKTDDKDPETLFIDLRPKDGLMYTKLINLFDDIQKELDTSFAILGEIYGRYKKHLKLRYRRVKTNLKNRKIIKSLPYVAGIYKFEADTDLFKLLVGPLYGYNPLIGVRELIQNAVDACIELEYKKNNAYSPLIEIKINTIKDKFIFSITDNGKGMSIGEIKNYFLKAGASFRNSTEWKIDYQQENFTPAIRRTGKFGIGVLASFLLGDSIEITTKRYNEEIGYTFNADLTNEYIEIKKNHKAQVGTSIIIQINKDIYSKLIENENELINWYIFDYPKIIYFIEDRQINKDNMDEFKTIHLSNNKQLLTDSLNINYKDFDDIIWSYNIENSLAINGLVIPNIYFKEPKSRYFLQKDHEKSIYDEIEVYPFVSILDRNNLIELELNRNSIRGDLPFITELIESIKLDFLYKLLFFTAPLKNNILNFENSRMQYWNGGYSIELDTKQFRTKEIFVTREGYFLDNAFYNPVIKNLNYYKLFNNYSTNKNVHIIDNSVYKLIHYSGMQGEQSILRGDYGLYTAISKPEIYLSNCDSKKIKKSVRENLKIIEKTDDFIIFTNGNYKIECKETLINLFSKNNAMAVQVCNKSCHTPWYTNDYPFELLKKHINIPKIIPHDFEEKKKYARTLSKELQQHIIEKRGIDL